MKPSGRVYVKLLHLVIFLTLGAACSAAEMVTIKMPEGTMRCEVLKMSKTEINMRDSGGKSLNVPLGVLTPAEVLACYKSLDAKSKTADLRFDMGSWFMNKKLNDAAKEELMEAVKLDDKMVDKIAPLLKKLGGGAEAPAPPPAKTEKEPTFVGPDPDKPKEPKEPKDPKEVSKKDPENGFVVSPGDTAEDIQKKAEDFSKKFNHRNVPARSEKDMKDFLDKQLADLNAKISGSGKWRMIETKHFYSFSNIVEPKHKMVSNDWLEAASNADGSQGIYPLLCTVLRHKEGDKLWNNKCPIYFFNTYAEFQQFAAQFDGSPGAGNSGGYFSAMGREVHICIPFMTQRLGEKGADRSARNTLYHEGTHAFLQLTGEDVPLTRWLHEGLAQFIEFWYDAKNNPDRNSRASFLVQETRAGNIPSWSEMRERPMGGMDLTGYGWAWIKLEFFYRNFDNQKLPTMIKLIKGGKAEDAAMQEAFGFAPDKLEAGFLPWLKEGAKKSFNFAK